MIVSSPLRTPLSTDQAGSAAGNNALSGPTLHDADFARIATIAHREAGLAIGAGKSAMVRTRLARRLRALGLSSFAAYCDYVEGAEGRAEIGLMISALTTNVSHFFRESHHFDILRTRVLPALVERAKAGKRVRIWSAGSSNGQEPYSIVMSMIESGLPLDRDVRVLATDIDPNVIAFASKGRYPEPMLSGLPDAHRARHFELVGSGPDPEWQVSDELKRPITFRVLNLLDTWPMQGRFDAIMCRNVVIYFDAETQDRLWHRFADRLEPQGWLFLGHSERLSASVKHRFEGRGITTYQHVDQGGAAGPTGVSQKGS